jgi:hypothetical protein
MRGLDYDRSSEFSIPKRLVDLERRIEEVERMVPSNLFPGGGTKMVVPGVINIPTDSDYKMADYSLAIARGAGPYFMIPALRGLWCAGAADESCDVYDLTGQGRTLTAYNSPSQDFLYGMPCVDYGGTNQHHRRADEAALDITGTDAAIAASRRGLTIGGWFNFDDAGPPANEECLIGKRTDATGNHSYWLRRESTAGRIAFHISSNGTANTVVNSGSLILNKNEWHLIVGVLDAYNDTQKLWVDDNYFETVNTGTIFSGTGPFSIGSFEGLDGYLDGKWSWAFVAAAHTPNSVVQAIYNLTRSVHWWQLS